MLKGLWFWKFVKIRPRRLKEIRKSILSQCKSRSKDIKGRIYIAPEGINAQMMVPSHLLHDVKEIIQQIPEFSDIEINSEVKEYRLINYTNNNNTHPNHNEDSNNTNFLRSEFPSPSSTSSSHFNYNYDNNNKFKFLKEEIIPTPETTHSPIIITSTSSSLSPEVLTSTFTDQRSDDNSNNTTSNEGDDDDDDGNRKKNRKYGELKKEPFKSLSVIIRNFLISNAKHDEHQIELKLNLTSEIGQKLKPSDWHNEVLSSLSSENKAKYAILDCRNDYEYEVGRFEGSIPLGTSQYNESYRVLKEMKNELHDKRVLMYCTGGIRCIKLGAYLNQVLNITNVAMLEGGINAYSNYLATSSTSPSTSPSTSQFSPNEGDSSRDGDDENENKMKEKRSLFRGVNFVFDERLTNEVTSDKLTSCFRCNQPTNQKRNCMNPCCSLLISLCDDCNDHHHGTCRSECQRYFNFSADEKRWLRRETGRILKFIQQQQHQHPQHHNIANNNSNCNNNSSNALRYPSVHYYSLALSNFYRYYHLENQIECDRNRNQNNNNHNQPGNNNDDLKINLHYSPPQNDQCCNNDHHQCCNHHHHHKKESHNNNNNINNNSNDNNNDNDNKCNNNNNNNQKSNDEEENMKRGKHAMDYPQLYKELEKYCISHSSPPSHHHHHQILTQIITSTMKSFPTNIHQLSGPLVTQLLSHLIHITNASRIVEIGCFTGYSAISMALTLLSRGNGSGGNVLTCEVNSIYADEAQRHFDEFHSSLLNSHLNLPIITLKRMKGIDLLSNLLSSSPTSSSPSSLIDLHHHHYHDRRDGSNTDGGGEEGKVDMIYIDADKKGYKEYYEFIIDNQLLRKGGCLVFDNVLWKGLILPPSSSQIVGGGNDDDDLMSNTKLQSIALKMIAFNDFVRSDDRVHCLYLPIRDGVLLVTPK